MIFQYLKRLKVCKTLGEHLHLSYEFITSTTAATWWLKYQTHLLRTNDFDTLAIFALSPTRFPGFFFLFRVCEQYDNTGS